MELVVTCEFRFYRTPDQKVWTSSAFVYQFWQRYLVSFEKVIAVARIKDVDVPQETWQLSSGNNVEFVALPYYVGLSGLLKNLSKIRKIITLETTPDRAVIYRVPSQSAMLASIGRGRQHGFALEVVGDPYDVFNAGITQGPLDKILAWLSYRGLQNMAANALASCYVTKAYLQKRYPVRQGALSIGCSDIELPAHRYVKESRVFTQPGRRIVFVGSFAQLYKGPDLLLRAIAKLKQEGNTYQVTMLGGGRYLDEMKTLARDLDCHQQIQFVGEVGQEQVTAHLDAADIFVMPSRTEGLPRALIEAMARGLPCIASDVGGIPELLPKQFMVSSDDWQSLAQRLHHLLGSAPMLTDASNQNLLRAQEYEYALLAKQRENFYQSYYQFKKGVL